MVRVWSDVVRFAERIWEEHVPIVIVYGGLVLTHGGERGRCKVGEEEKLKSEFLCWFTFISSVFVQGRLRCPSKAHMFFLLHHLVSVYCPFWIYYPPALH